LSDNTAQASIMNYNGCSNSPTTVLNFNFSSYLISVWIKLDKFNEFCTSDLTLRYYLIAFPHVIYAQTPNKLPLVNLDTNFFYFNALTNQRIKITGLSNFNFNLISIFYNEQTKQFRLILNNNYKTPAVAIDEAAPNQNLLMKLIFCPNGNKCNNVSVNTSLPNEFIWGSAFYKDLKVFNGVVYNYFTYEEKEINMRK
jgi:hypothetical protein